MDSASAARRLEAAVHVSDMHPLLKSRLGKPRSVFYPGHRIRMNIVPMFLSVFVPWGIFVFVAGLAGFRAMYKYPVLVWAIFAFLLIAWLVLVFLAVAHRMNDTEPTWFTYMALVTGVFAVAGLMVGLYTFHWHTKPYMEVRDLKVAGGVDAGRAFGQNLMDSAIFNFKRGNALDPARSWHFKYESIFCVAPIVTNGSMPMTLSYDFWAVGKDCCSEGASDFRCGSWGNSEARSAIRVFNDDELVYYHLAVKQAEAMYDIVAKHPIFVQWSEDPYLEVESWNHNGLIIKLEWDGLAFVTSVFLMTIATCSFSWIGRRSSWYDRAILDELPRDVLPKDKANMYTA